MHRPYQYLSTISASLISLYITLFYPNLILNILPLKQVIKYPFLFIILLLFLSIQLRNTSLKLYPEALSFLLLLVPTIVHDSDRILETLSIFLFLLFLPRFFQVKQFVSSFFYIYTIVAYVTSIHALLQLLVISSPLLNLFTLYAPIVHDLGTPHFFNPLLGVIDSPIFPGFRVSSFFTESNRLAYFLIPPLFLAYSCVKVPLKRCRPLLPIVILFTGSIAGFLMLFLTIFVFYPRTRKYVVIFAPVTVAYIIATLFFSDLIPLALNRSFSLSTRILSFNHLIFTLPNYPFGFDQTSLSHLTELFPSYTAVIHWSNVGGVISLFGFGSLFLSVFLRLRRLSSIPSLRPFVAGIFCYSCLQIFLGTGVELLFVSLVSFVISMDLAHPPSRASLVKS